MVLLRHSRTTILVGSHLGLPPTLEPSHEPIDHNQLQSLVHTVERRTQKSV